MVDDTLYATADGGKSWRKVATAPWLATAGRLDFVDDLHGWALAGTYGHTRLMVTQDGGRQWTTIAPTIAG